MSDAEQKVAATEPLEEPSDNSVDTNTAYVG